MRIENSTLADVSKIFELYRVARDFMKSKNQVYWPEFPKKLIINEIEENRQWKLLINEQIACIWATTLNDELIWGNENNEPSLYIHRIATNPEFRGQNLVRTLINWANEFGNNKNLKYIRMDTVGLNKGLISHYEKLGFEFLGTKEIKNTNGMPEHYKDGEVCYFQKEITRIKATMKINYNNKKFSPIENSESGETTAETVFKYEQKGNILTSEYNGGQIISGHLIGLVDENGNIEMRYHQVNTKGELMTGICKSKPELLPNGKIRLFEDWK